MKIYVCTAEDYDVHYICKAFYNEDQAKEWTERQTLEDNARKEAYKAWHSALQKAKQDKFGCTYPSNKVSYSELREFEHEFKQLSPAPFSGTGYGYGYYVVEVE